MTGGTVIVPSVQGGAQLERLLQSLARQTASHQTIIVDNGSVGGHVSAVARAFEFADVIRQEENVGFARAVNHAARRADGDVLVVTNDDCVCDPCFVEQMTLRVNAAAGLTMVAGVMRDARNPSLIDTAGMELDRTLLAFDYLNGEPLSKLELGVRAPFGPSGAAAAFDRASYLSAGGYDEALFAYWEDVDLALRLRLAGARCALAVSATGTHEHSATLGSGSARKNYLMGYGRGYVLRRWGATAPSLIPAVLARETVTCAGQALIDRNLAGVRGRVHGFRATGRTFDYPQTVVDQSISASATLARRARRRKRLDARIDGDVPPRT